MPCRDYASDSYSSPTSTWQYQEMKDRADMLARIACKAMTELAEQGRAEFLVLRDDEVREWWHKHQEADRKAQEAAEEKKRIAQVRREALKKLTAEERKALGIKTVKK